MSYIEGDAADLDAMLHDYSRRLLAGPIDLAFVGISENGRIAFNDPHVADFCPGSLVRAHPSAALYLDLHSAALLSESYLTSNCRVHVASGPIGAAASDCVTPLMLPDPFRLRVDECWRYGWRVHADVLMKNRYHLTVEMPWANLREQMHSSS